MEAVTETYLHFEKLHLEGIKPMRNYQDADDFTLLRGCVFNHREARTEFFSRYNGFIHTVVRATVHRYCRKVDPTIIEDLVQDVFVALLGGNCRRLRMFEGKNGCPLRAWIRVISMRTTVSKMRKWKNHLSLNATVNDKMPLERVLVDDSLHPETFAASQEKQVQVRILMSLLDELSDADKALFEMIYVEEASVPEITARLNVRRGALYMRKNRVIERLRNRAMKRGAIER